VIVCRLILSLSGSPEVDVGGVGGVARISRMPEKPAQELAVAVAGPTVNVVIAFVLFLILGTIKPDALSRIDDPQISFVARLAAANIFLVIFNMSRSASRSSTSRKLRVNRR
jgi:Zn-dependent protease